MLGGVQRNGICECSNELTVSSDEGICKRVVLDAVSRNDNGCFLIYNQDSVECQDQFTDKIYQKFTNVCRRGSINTEQIFNNNEKDVTIESFEQYSTGFESNCTSTQTPSVQDANVQTTPSLESLADKFSSCSHSRIRNYINYSRLGSSTKVSSIESSVKDESTQYCDSCESEHKIISGAHAKSLHISCCNQRDYCHIHDPFFLPCDGIDSECSFKNENFNLKSHRSPCAEHITDVRNHKGPYRMNSICSQDSAQFSCIHLPQICHCMSHYSKVNAIPDLYELQKSSLQFTQPTNFTAQNHVSIVKTDDRRENCRLEVVDEKNKSKEIEMKLFKVIKKAKSYDCLNLETEQTKPLLSDLSKINKNTANDHDDDDEEENNEPDETEKLKAECPNGTCHCMHEISPESLHRNCIQVRPSRTKSSKRTSPLKVITITLFASAFLITGSAIKDAYYQ